MKIKLTGPITSMERGAMVQLKFLFEGSVEGKTLESKKAQLGGELFLKPVVANELKMGTILHIVITDYDPDDTNEAD